MSDDFDWTEKSVLVVKPTRAIAVYENSDGDVVIRQESALYEGDDPFIVIPREKVGCVIDRLFELGKPDQDK